MSNFFKNKFLISIILLAAGLRLFGLNWDQGQHLHPDERFLTMVATAIKIPRNLPEYLDPQLSPFSPYNVGYSFFVYGTFPLYLTKVLGEIFKLNHYGNLHLLGRALSAFFDVGVVFLIFKTGQKIYSEETGLWAAFLYSLMVLPIQLSHFFAVDTFLNFFLFLTFFLLILLTEKYTLQRLVGLGVAFGLALACKISALYFLPVIGLVFLFMLWRKNIWHLSGGGVIVLIISLLVFRFNQPPAFTSSSFFNWRPNLQFVSNLKELEAFNQPNSWYPPGVQWKKTTPLIFPLKNMIFWGLGAPLGIIALTSLGFVFYKTIKNKNHNSLFTIHNSLILLWTSGLFFYLGLQYCKTMRYFLPLYPYLALTSGFLLNELLKKIASKSKKLNLAAFFLLIATLLIYPFSFMAIYTRPITRVAASAWIYQNIPAKATLATEYWDDPLPLRLPAYPAISYPTETLSLYDEESPEKWHKINQQLAKADFIILSSNRLYGSIPKNPDHYPQTTQYYQDLFSGRLNFVKVAEFTSYPCFPPIGPKLFCLNDDSAEEAFTVYDHPKVIIFQKKASSFGQKKN